MHHLYPCAEWNAGKCGESQSREHYQTYGCGKKENPKTFSVLRNKISAPRCSNAGKVKGNEAAAKRQRAPHGFKRRVAKASKRSKCRNTNGCQRSNQKPYVRYASKDRGIERKDCQE
jgi:hypothetical protein